MQLCDNANIRHNGLMLHNWGIAWRYRSMTEEKTVAIRVTMESDLRARFKAQCALNQTSMNDVVTELIQRWLQEQKGSPIHE